MRTTLLGFTVPDDMVAEINRTDASMATQTHRFAWGVVGGLKAAGVEVDLLSAAPVSDYPRNPNRSFPGGRFHEHGVDGRFLPFVNLLGLKHFTRGLSAWSVGGRHLRKTRPDWLLVHGVHSPLLWYAVYAKRRFGVQIAVFLTDPPGVVLSSDSGLRLQLKTLDIRITKRALAKMDAVVVLTAPLASDFAPGVPHLVMEGLFDADQWGKAATAVSPTDGTRVITYAGGLSEEYGVGLLTRAVLASKDPDIRLQLFGRGPLEDWIRQAASADSRVMEPRLLHPQELAGVYARSAVLVQPRPPDLGFVRYSFPSKLLEYMASGTPVVTTRLPSIPPEYADYVTWAEASEEGLAAALHEVLSLPEETRHTAGARAAEFVRTSRSAVAQGRRIADFLAATSSGRD